MSKPAIDQLFYSTRQYYQQLVGFVGPTGPINVTNETYLALERHVAPTAENAAGIALRRQGIAVWLPPLYYHSNKDRFDIYYGREERRILGFIPGFIRWGFLNPSVPASPVVPGDLGRLRDVVAKKLLTKLKNQNVNFAQFFVEADDLARGVGKTAKSLAGALVKCRNGNIVGALKSLGSNLNKRQLSRVASAVQRDGRRIARSLGNEFIGANASQASKNAAGNWLAMQFMWLPTLSDLEGTAKLLAERTTQDPKRTRFNVRAVTKFDMSSRSFKSQSGKLHTTTEYRGYVGCLMRADFFFSNAALASATADGLMNPTAVAWESVPFSFLADYVTDIGGYVNNLDSAFGKEFVGGSLTFFEDWTARIETRYVGDELLSGYRKGQRSRKSMRREVMESFPDATMIALTVNNPLRSARRIGNSLALLRQAIDSYK